MSTYELFLFLHVASVIVWLGAGTTLAVLWLSPDSVLRARVGELGAWLGPRLFAPASLGALAFGLVLVQKGSWTFHPLWIKLGLAAFATSFVLNAGVRARLLRRLERDPVGVGKRLAALARFEIAVLYLTVADMVAKPTTADVWTLAVLGGILALVAASSLLGLRT